MPALLLLVGVVCLLGGILLGWVARDLFEPDPWDDFIHKAGRIQ